ENVKEEANIVTSSFIYCKINRNISRSSSISREIRHYFLSIFLLIPLVLRLLLCRFPYLFHNTYSFPSQAPCYLQLPKQGELRLKNLQMELALDLFGWALSFLRELKVRDECLPCQQALLGARTSCHPR